MKKVMIGILILIPILILVVVQAVSVVVSTRTHIGVESVSLDKSTLELGFDDAEYDFNDYLNVTVLPERATDRTVTWVIADLKCMDADYAAKYANYLEHGQEENYDGEVVLPPATLVDGNGNAVSENSTGRFRLGSYCSFYVEVHAEIQVARCLVYVSGYTVQKISVLGASTVAVGASTRLSSACTPVDSILDELTWESSDPSVLSVDANGVATGKRAGSASVTVKAISPGQDEYVTSAEYPVTVTASVTALGNKPVFGSNVISLEALGLSAADITAVENCTVEGENLKINAPGATITTVNGNAEIVLCEENDIEIGNGKEYGFDASRENNYALEVGGLPLVLSVVWKDMLQSGTPEGVVWSVDRPAIASVDENGRVIGKNRGVVVVTATVGEGAEEKTASITIAVENKVSSLILSLTDSSLAVGLARETVFASSRYTDGTFTTQQANNVTVDVLRPTAPLESSDLDAYYDAFRFEVLEKDGESLVASEKASFEKNVLTFLPSKITERTELTVRVSAKYPKYELYRDYTVCTFKLNVVDGLAVGSYYELVAAAATKSNICFENDVKMLDGDPTPFTQAFQGSIMLYSDVYGNNFTYSAAFRQMYDYSGMFEVLEDNVDISNIHIRCCDVEDEITDANGNKGLWGKAIGIGCQTYWAKRLQNTTVKYCLLENGSGCINLWGADLYVEGCILRNTSGCAFFIQTGRAGESVIYSNLTVKNCVMSNMVGTGFSFPYSGYSSTGDEESIARAKADVAAGRNSTFTQLGFLDIYNWQSVEILNLIDLDGLDDSLLSLINGYARTEVMSNPAFEPYCILYNGVKYFHLGFITNGFVEPTYLEPKLEDKRFGMITTESISIELVSAAPPIKIFGYSGSETEIPPGKTYKINEKLINKLHGIL